MKSTGKPEGRYWVGCSAFLINCLSLNLALLLQPSFSFLASAVETTATKLWIVMENVAHNAIESLHSPITRITQYWSGSWVGSRDWISANSMDLFGFGPFFGWSLMQRTRVSKKEVLPVPQEQLHTHPQALRTGGNVQGGHNHVGQTWKSWMTCTGSSAGQVGTHSPKACWDVGT